MNKSSFNNINPLSHYSVHELLCDSADNQHEKSDVIQNDEKRPAHKSYETIDVLITETGYIPSGKETECMQEAQEWSAYRSVDLFNNKQYTSVPLLVKEYYSSRFTF